MYWFIAKVVFNIVSGDGDHTPQFDEQYRLIKAASREEAFQKAISIGLNEQDVMINTSNEIVRWDFVNVSELYAINELQDGMELFSSVAEADNRKDYMEIVNLKSAYVQSKFERVSASA